MLISDFCIRHPVFAIVINLILALLGLYAFDKLSIRQMPKMEAPVVVITTAYAGASPDQVERQVTTPIEAAVAAISGIDEVTSKSRSGVSTVQVRFRLGLDGVALANDIRNKLSAIRNQLPQATEAPTVNQVSMDAIPIMYLTLSSETRDPLEISALAKQEVAPRISVIDGVAQASLIGERRYSIRLQLDPVRLGAYGITIDEVAGALKAQNVDMPGGEIRSLTDRQSVLLSTSMASAEQFNNLIIGNKGGYLVRLGDIGKAVVGAESSDTAMRYNGRDVVAISVLPQSTANPLDISKEVRARLPHIMAGLPSDLKVEVAFDSTVFIKASVDEVFETIVIAVVLVLMVLFVFLGSPRSAAIAIVTIPLSLLGTLALMWVMGFSINTFTLLAVVLAIGLVVDDAIVEIENVQRHVDAGLDAIAASFVGSREIGFAVIATTLTLAAVFAPIGLVEGQIGMLFREFALTLAGSVIISGYIARTLSPMMCSRMIRPRSGRGLAAAIEHRLDALGHRFGRLLEKVLARRWLVTIGVAVSFAVAIVATGRLGFQFAPNEDQGYVLINMEAQTTATLAYLEEHAKEVEAVLSEVPEGRGALVMLGTPKTNVAVAYLMLKPWNQRSRTAQQIGQELAGKLVAVPGLRVSVLDTNPLGGANSHPIEATIRTTADYAQLAGAMSALLEKARNSPALLDPSSSLVLDKPQLLVTIDRDLAADQGVTVASLGNALLTVLGGSAASSFNSGGELYKVILELSKEWQGQADAIYNIRVRTAAGEMRSLRTFVDVVDTVGPDMLEHADGRRAATFTAGIAPGHTAREALMALQSAAAETLPPGIQLALGGDSGKAAKSSSSAALVILLGLVFIYFMLSAQFESFRDPVIILGVVPLAICGALVTLAVTGGTLNIYSMIGFVTLVGLIAKHGILITEFANQLRDQGLSREKAVVQAAAMRLRPILMTTLAAVLSAIPLAEASGAGAVSRSQLGWVLIGGLVYGTLVSLFVVPVSYSLLSPRVRKPLVEAPADLAA
ncbi:MAG TPA: efflux RND transporter permease subunit [Magnetospirillum sp.]|nr:efflux RND transporter permease subunit [Magnetospirillum sp.]